MEIVDGREYIAEVRAMITEYTNSLGRDLTFQHIDEELDDPGKKYTPPMGEVLIAMDEASAVGMVAYHRHSAVRCEMKRLYIKPKYRGLQLGEKLVAEIMTHAKAAGYKEMVLDTLEPMKAAIGLYQKNGFEVCEPYYNNPMNDVIYMIKKL